MASTEMSASANGSRKVAAESGHVLPPPPGLLGVDFCLKLLLFAYAVSALPVTYLYSIVTMMAVFFAICPSTRRLFLLGIFDALMAGVMASATGAAGSVAYIGLKGNSHANWSIVYNVTASFAGTSAARSPSPSSPPYSSSFSSCSQRTPSTAVVTGHLMHTTNIQHTVVKFVPRPICCVHSPVAAVHLV
ncbi:CASP-like protein [Musa troglodytarum]|uniref:CASP-like protein n=1 Tax=Musa troglodytarum TaxID=320322 RepID=A0A9E7G873_9LILI|nr:CASP-like protein [Musa troglodytarum]